jgi:hypothetical protein
MSCFVLGLAISYYIYFKYGLSYHAEKNDVHRKLKMFTAQYLPSLKGNKHC